MMDDDEESGFLIRKTSQDKLTYKNVIQNRINWCLMTIGTMSFPDAVRALERSIIFDLTGFRFKTELEKIHEDAKKRAEERKEQMKEKLGRGFLKRSVQAKFKIKQQEQYWIDVYDEILQQIADHKLLIDYEKTLSVKKAGGGN